MTQHATAQLTAFLKNIGITAEKIQPNLSASDLRYLAISSAEGQETIHGALRVSTGQHTGRSANDRFIVKNGAADNPQNPGFGVHWDKPGASTPNKPLSPEKFALLKQDITAWLSENAPKGLFVQDCFAGTHKTYRQAVRVVTPNAWHGLFAHNMFVRPTREESAGFTPDITVLHAPEFMADSTRHGGNSGTMIVLDFASRTVLICGTSYAGEMKKSVFSMMNFFLPQQGVLPMHASANMTITPEGTQGDTAIFFGLSGTGKTTLSADATRTLIGDDEHGWADEIDAGGTGNTSIVFNIEGGCYAKTIRLDQEAEPEIYAATQQERCILENVVLRPDGTPDFDDASLTENTRASYPIELIPNASPTGMGGQPTAIIMLTCDAFGVLPPLAKLTPEQAMYHFLSGYTAKIAGTEKGLGTEPQATFSACFGLPFMPLNPVVYGKMLAEKMKKNGTSCWLVNTGWTGGEFGVGERISIYHTRALVNAALSGALNETETFTEPFFGLHVPATCEGVPHDIMNPRNCWRSTAEYDTTALKVQDMFRENFSRYASEAQDVLPKKLPEAA